jgi:pimeloyl-ACP methyl ester carboxylesterase
MREKALLFGDEKSLVGVVTDADPAITPRGRGVIILNAGVLHRVGPNRVHVKLARTLAASGFVVLRFDFSGIGDSGRAVGSEAFVQRAVREAMQAMDVLRQSHGISEFVVAGICAGADYGLQVASRDPRVVGAVLIDGYNLTSLGMALYFYRWKLVNPWSWIRFLAGRSLTWSAVRNVTMNPGATRAVRAAADSMLPTPTEFVGQIRSLTERGAELLLFYTGESPSYYNYRRLLRRSMGSWPFKQRVSVEHMADSDHVFTLRQNRERLVELVCRWAERLSPPAAR